MPKTTYHTIPTRKKDILSPYVDNSVGMLYKGDFSEGDGLLKSRFSKGLIYSKNASSLFGLNRGYVGLVVSFPENFYNGVYYPLRNSTSEIGKYILWGVNVGKYGAVNPGIEVSLTKNGIEFKIMSPLSEFSILDTYSNINANTDIFFEFLWDANGLDDFKTNTNITMAYRINGHDIVIANPPISNETISNYNFCVLNTPFLNSGLECTLKEICIRDGLSQDAIYEWQSSSMSSSSVSSRSSQSRSSQSSRSNSSSSSTSSIQEQTLGKYMVLCEFSKLYGGTRVGGDIWTSNDRGLSWTQRTTFTNGSSLAGFWKSTAISKDGKYQLIGGLFRNTRLGVIGAYPVAKSSNFGQTWSTINISPSFSYDTQFSVALSENGKYQTLCPLLTTASVTGGMKILVSDNYGSTFAQKGTTRRWSAISVSGEGRYQTACADGEKVYLSNNFGNAWTPVPNVMLPNSNWTDVVMSSNGKYQCVVAPDKFYTSDNYGQGWIVRGAAGAGISFKNVDMSSDGKIILVSIGNFTNENTTNTGSYMYSNNYGEAGSWSQINLPQLATPTQIWDFVMNWSGEDLYQIRGKGTDRQYGFIENLPNGSLSEGGDIKEWSAITLNK